MLVLVFFSAFLPWVLWLGAGHVLASVDNVSIEYIDVTLALALAYYVLFITLITAVILLWWRTNALSKRLCAAEKERQDETDDLH